MQKLFEGFSPVSAFEWKARIEKDLKGITFDSLVKTDRNGIEIKPFYNSEDAQENMPLFDNADWEICASVHVSDEKTANKKALNALSNGVSGLQFIIYDTVDLNILLKNISIAHIYLQFVVRKNEAAFLVAFQNYTTAAGLHLKDLNCSIQADAIGNFILNGNWETNAKAEKLNYLLMNSATKDLFPVSINGAIYQNAGANQVTELAATLAHLNEYLLWLHKNKQLSIVNKVHVSLAVGTDFFEEIAKLRAFRELCNLLFESYAISPVLHLHCETSDIYRSTFDSYTNLLRDSVAGMAAVLGGSNSLVIHSFNNKESDFSDRMSRNQQLIFKEEAYLNKVADVAAGSFFIENLTEQLAEKAWKKFQEIEKNGGLIASADILHKNIKQESEELIESYRNGKRVLIGVNKYPNPTEPVQKMKRTSSSQTLKQISLTEELLSE